MGERVSLKVYSLAVLQLLYNGLIKNLLYSCTVQKWRLEGIRLRSKRNTIFKVFLYTIILQAQCLFCIVLLYKVVLYLIICSTSICCTSFRGISSTNVKQSVSTSAPANREALVQEASIVLKTRKRSIVFYRVPSIEIIISMLTYFVFYFSVMSACIALPSSDSFRMSAEEKINVIYSYVHYANFYIFVRER